MMINVQRIILWVIKGGDYLFSGVQSWLLPFFFHPVLFCSAQPAGYKRDSEIYSMHIRMKKFTFHFSPEILFVKDVVMQNIMIKLGYFIVYIKGQLSFD